MKKTEDLPNIQSIQSIILEKYRLYEMC